MKKRKYLFIVLSLGLLIILLAVTYSYVKHQEHLVARHHLLCEVLTPGMSEDEVLGILHQAGEFTINKGGMDRGSQYRIGYKLYRPQGQRPVWWF
jgi:hypothetical protein